MQCSLSRQQAVDIAMSMFDTAFFKALQEPARIAILRRLLLIGRADIALIAQGLPQERSVISRHLRVLEEAGILKATKEGRHRYFEVNGQVVLRQLQAMTSQVALVMHDCCPG
ncbi:MAG: hypothetical protein RLZZ369_108 [Pseudomonadota bacterium]|jgi:DNA-binding transcriptional ArsR family regulator